MYPYYMLSAVIKVKNSIHMSRNWGFGHATKSKAAANQRCEKTYRAFTLSRCCFSGRGCQREACYGYNPLITLPFVQQTTMSS